jgi:hypothetical protein
VVPTALPTLLKVLLEFDPNVAIAAMQTTMISASMTAYSTAVGPSSSLIKWWTNRVIEHMAVPRNRGEMLHEMRGFVPDEHSNWHRNLGRGMRQVKQNAQRVPLGADGEAEEKRKKAQRREAG